MEDYRDTGLRRFKDDFDPEEALKPFSKWSFFWGRVFHFLFTIGK